MNSVIKGTGYVLVHTPDMVLHNGTTQTTERIVNPESEYLKELPRHLRSYEDVISYYPNQTYIGNVTCQSKSDCITCKIIKRIRTKIIFFKPYALDIAALCFLCI